MSEKSSKFLFIFEIYKVVILTVIAIMLFISIFDISIEKKSPLSSINESPLLEIETKEGGVEVNTVSERDLLIRAKTNRDELSQNCSIIATECQRYYRTPKNNGGGGMSFIGFTMDEKNRYTDQGSYSLEIVNSKKVLITGVGVETGTDNINPVKVECSVNPGVIQMNNEN